VGLDVNSLSAGARAEVDRISRLEGTQLLEGFGAFAQAVRERTSLVLPIVGPSAPHRCTEQQLRRCHETALELDTMIHMHVCETKGQFLQGKSLFGTSPVCHLDSIGVLSDRLSMAHCVWLTDEDIERIAAQGAVVIHNPASNGKLGSGRMRFDDMLRKGVRLGLATDGSGSNDTQNMFEALRIAGLWHNRCDRDYAQWPAAEDIFRAATSGSAQALGLRDSAGVIAAGRLADMAMLTTASYHFVPLNNVINQLIYCENGISVTDVMIDGRWVLRARKLLTIDEERLYVRARALRAEMEARIGEQFRRTAELEPALRQQYLKAAATDWSESQQGG
jgi:cytosine/adenosine deaminase-related metal-dependent hydrolase